MRVPATPFDGQFLWFRFEDRLRPITMGALDVLGRQTGAMTEAGA